MLVVKVEVWPGGDPHRAFEIARIGAANVSGLADVSDYEVVALLGQHEDEETVRSYIDKHERSAGWLPLVRRILTNLILRRELTSEAPYDDPVAELLRKENRV